MALTQNLKNDVVDYNEFKKIKKEQKKKWSLAKTEIKNVTEEKVLNIDDSKRNQLRQLVERKIGVCVIKILGKK